MSNIETLPPPTSKQVAERRNTTRVRPITPIKPRDFIDLRLIEKPKEVERKQFVKDGKAAQEARRSLRSLGATSLQKVVPAMAEVLPLQPTAEPLRKLQKHESRRSNRLRRKVAAVGLGILAFLAPFGSGGKLSAEKSMQQPVPAVAIAPNHHSTQNIKQLHLTTAPAAEAVQTEIHFDNQAENPWTAYVEAYGNNALAAEHLQEDINNNPNIEVHGTGTNQSLSVNGHYDTSTVIQSLRNHNE